MRSSNPNVFPKALSPKSHRTPRASVYEYGGWGHKPSVHCVSLLRTPYFPPKALSAPLRHSRKLADTRLPQLFGEQLRSGTPACM